jgi:hypothetical protein
MHRKLASTRNQRCDCALRACQLCRTFCRMAGYLDLHSELGRSVRLYLDAPCICGAKMPLRSCCLARRGTVVPRSTPSSTLPPPPQTALANERCYAAVLHDCDDRMSKEHYFSRGVLRALAAGSANNTVRARGLGHPEIDLPPDQVGQSKILCRRHNPQSARSIQRAAESSPRSVKRSSSSLATAVACSSASM